MRDYAEELEKRVEWIRSVVKEAHADGIIFGNSGGKDSALVGILCKMACPNTTGVIMPCASKRNFGEDTEDGLAVADMFGIETRVVDLTAVREKLIEEIDEGLGDDAIKNIAPRLRMVTLYAMGQAENRLVAGTGNKDELYIGYYTKWGDGAADFNPVSDLDVGEVYEFLKYLKAPAHIINKAPSAGLFEGQTDEAETGIKYADIDRYLETGEGDPETVAKIEKMHAATAHKRSGVKFYNCQRQA